MAEKSLLALTRQNDVTIVGFNEPNLLDAYHIEDTAPQLYQLIDTDKHKLIVLDLAGISMISSQSLGVFLNMKQKLDQQDGKMAISGIDPGLSRVFKITRLQDVFKFFNDSDAAVNSFLT
ncbi:MAG: STAS domain-containing protein [Planctomycetes bacterium]|nr:STAS domain-containing protein [Planctomycetota bacterium]